MKYVIDEVIFQVEFGGDTKAPGLKGRVWNPPLTEVKSLNFGGI